MASTAFTAPQAQPQGARSFVGKLNGPWHKRALQTFMIVVIAHWAEHLVQAYQVYVLKWPVHEARGVLGQAFPWLVHSEVLQDRKSTRLNSSHLVISYAVFCLKKKKNKITYSPSPYTKNTKNYSIKYI